MEATLNHVPAFAMSLVHAQRAFDYDDAAQFAGNWPQRVLAEGLPPGVLLNVNVPLDWSGGVRFTRQSKKVTRTVLLQGSDPRGRTYYWLNQQQSPATWIPTATTPLFSPATFPSLPWYSTSRTKLPSIICPTGRNCWNGRGGSVATNGRKADPSL